MEKFEIHYYLENEIHAMDAFVKNKAEFELLKIFSDISDSLELDLTFEIEALKEGGIREFIKVLKNKKTIKQLVRILAFIGVIFSGVITNVISDNLTKDKELEKLQKEELNLQIKKLKRDLESDDISDSDTTLIIESLTILLSNVDKIKLHKSNFYTSLLTESKIEKISTTELDDDYKPLSQERFVNRDDFKKYIIDKIKIDPEYIEEANIQIVAPILNNVNMKWKGYYDSKPISFNLHDIDFKNSVLNREVSFSSGTSIKCSLEFEKEMDNEGNIKIVDVNVYDIVNVFEGEKIFITKKGKQIIDDKRQFTLDFNENDEK